MLRLDNLKEAKRVVQSITDGRHPYSGIPIGANDVCADKRVVQWLNLIVKELNYSITKLENYIAKANDRHAMTTFNITEEQLNAYNYSDVPITITEIARRLNEAAGIEVDATDAISPITLNRWLIKDGILEEIELPEGKVKVATELGEKFGVTSCERSFDGKKYISVTYNKSGQYYIISHLEEYLDKYNKERSCHAEIDY